MNRNNMILHVIIALCDLYNCLTNVVNVENFILEGQEPRKVLPEARLAINELMINENAGAAKREYLA